MIKLNKKEDKIPNEFKKIAKDFSEKGISTLDDFWFSLLCY